MWLCTYMCVQVATPVPMKCIALYCMSTSVRLSVKQGIDIVSFFKTAAPIAYDWLDGDQCVCVEGGLRPKLFGLDQGSVIQTNVP